MSGYIVHHAPLTRSVRTVWAMRELGLEHEVVERPLDDRPTLLAYAQRLLKRPAVQGILELPASMPQPLM